jgi:DNA-binding winged helix-turn-helix (wHTH) protein
MEQKSLQVRTARVIGFGIYEVDLEAAELRRSGVKVHLQGQPFQVLALLIAHPGQLLTREALQRQLWPDDALVDFDLGLNTAIKKIRAALQDSADNPRFVETLPKRGYRFIAPIQEIRQDIVSVAQDVHLESKQQATHSEVNGEKNSPSEPESPSDFVQPASAFQAARYKTHTYYWVLMLALVLGVALLVEQGAAKKLFQSSGHHTAQRGVYVYRTTTTPDGAAALGIGGYDLRSPNDQVFAFDYDHSGKLDHLVLFRPGVGNIRIVANAAGTFAPVYSGYGVAGYDLTSPHDRIFAFDYDHSGKLDHLVLYRPGTRMVWIVENRGNGIFTPVYKLAQNDTAIWSGTDDQPSTADQVFPIDYDHSGKLDYLVVYRPGREVISILKHAGGTLVPVHTQHVASDQVGENSPGSSTDQAFAFDYDHSGKLDHLVLYRPGEGHISIWKNAKGTLIPVYEGMGVGGYDLTSTNDRALAFDYDHSGKLDHLLLYRPGTGLLSVLKNSGGTFIPVSQGVGMKGYDLMSPRDRVVAFDYDHSGMLDHLVFYRPGVGDALITYFPAGH